MKKNHGLFFEIREHSCPSVNFLKKIMKIEGKKCFLFHVKEMTETKPTRKLKRKTKKEHVGIN